MIGRLLKTSVSTARVTRELTGTHANFSSMRSFLSRGFGDAQAAQKPSILHVKVVSKPEAIGSSETLVSDFKKQKTLLTYHDDKRVLYILRGNHKGEGDQNASEQPTPTQDANSNSAFSIVEAIMPRAKSLKATKIDVEIDGLEGKEQEDLEMLGLAFKLANHKYEIKSDDKKKEWIVTDISIQGNQGKQATTTSNYAFYDAMGEFKNLARDYADGRPNLLNTLNFLEHAKAFAEASNGKVKLTAIVGEDLAKQGLNLHYAVGKASANPPVLINLTFMNDPSTTNVHAIVGKGITFDAGGLHIKPYGSMEDMFYDKAGASAAFATFQGAVELGLKVNLTCTLGMAENMIAANAYRPSDIIHSLKGLTVEIRNTDAEGRLVLADAMTWTQKNVPNVVSLIEMSTLTGACLVALGERTAGLWTNDRDLAQGLKKASEKVREPLWEMPIYDDIRESLKGSHSDLVNISGARWAGSIVAAAFLENFVEKGVKWAHLDIAGPAHTNKPFSVYTKGCTGYGVGTLLEYYRTQAAK